MINKLLPFFFLFVVGACGPSRNITYFSNLQGTGITNEKIKNNIDSQIQPDDLLSITVSSLNPEANLLFNSGVIQSVGSSAGSSAPTTGRINEGYLVDKNGNINFPVLGSVKLAGLTKEQATDKMTAEIKHHIKDPIVNIKLLNFRITVIGEVTRPSSFAVPSEKINLMEALGLAGDMTVYGRRENILIIREKDGVRSTVRVNLNDKDVLNSPYYYLQQNDIMYVAPAKIRQTQSSSGAFYLGLAAAGVSIISLFVLLIKQ